MSSEQHQLAAILFTDIVGYTALMQQNENKAMELIRHYNEVLETCVKNHNGSIANNYGDGSLCIFPSANNAIHAAIAIQLGLQQEPVVPLRIGLHIGEVFFEEGRIFGDGVNVASRIQSMGQANSILFSREIYDKIKNHPEFSTVSLGKFAFKNVQDEMEVFSLSNPGLQVPEKKTLVGKLQGRKPPAKKWLWPGIALGIALLSILVYTFAFKKNGFTGREKSISIIPFTNKDSRDKDIEYLCFGVPEYVAGLLSNTGALSVKGLYAARDFRGSNKSTEEISAALNHPAALLMGRIEKLEKDIVITVDLIDAPTDKVLWSNPYHYNREGTEIFSIQSDVATQVAKALNMKLNTTQQDQINKEPTKSKEAFEDYLKGSYFLDKSVSEGPGEKLDDSAERYFLQAVKEDSTFALPWVGLADIYNARSNGGKADLELNNKGLTAIFKALQFDPENSDAFAIWGDLQKKYTLNSRLSLYFFDRAIRLNRNNTKAYFYKAQAFLDLNRFTEAKENIEKSLQLDPVHYISQLDPWENYALTTGDTTKLRYLLNKYGNSPYRFTNDNQRAYYFFSGKYDSLLMYALRKNDTIYLIKAYMGLRQVEKAKSLALLKIERLKEVSEDSNALRIAQCFVFINENQKALDYLYRAYNLRNYGVSDITSDFLGYSIRNEERFKQLVKKIAGN